MKKCKFLIILLVTALLAGALAPTAAALDDPPADSSRAIVLVAEKGSNETVIYTRNQDEKMSPASLTKVMTVLLAVEAIEAGTVKLTDPVTAQPGFDFDMIANGSSVYTVQGETMTLENLLYCAMVASANESCNIIAQYIGGSISNFVQMMNDRAAELGCTNTHFTNPHGLTDPNHYTTAWDFSRILREAAGHELFMDISNTITYTVPGTNMAAERHLENTNSLINPTNPMYPGPYGYEYARGVKTGHTSDAGYCLATTAEKDGITLLAVVLGADAYQLEDGSWYYGHFADAKALFEWAFDNFSYQEIVKSTEIIAELPVEMGSEADAVAVRPSTSIAALLPNDVDLEAFTRTVVLYPERDNTPLVAPVSAGQNVGEISVSLDGVVYGTASLITTTSIELSRVQYMKGQLAETLQRPGVVITFWSLVLLFFTYLLLVIRYRVKRRAYQKRLENARQIRLDLEDEEDEIRYERRARASSPVPNKLEVALEPESYRAKEAARAVDEPTRVSGQLPDLPDEPTRISGQLPVIEGDDAPAEEPPEPEEPAPEEQTRILAPAAAPAEPEPAEESVPAEETVDEPTRVIDRETPPGKTADEPEDAPVRDYFEEFFGKQ